MSVSIEFQIAGLIFALILCVAFFKKVKWDSTQNRIYKILLIITIVELALDIASVISIDHRDTYPTLNNILSKAYIIVMNLFIYTIDLYTLSCATDRKISPLAKKFKMATIILLSLMWSFIAIFTCVSTLYYSGYGRKIFSYGLPSDMTYMFSTFSVTLVIFILLLNIRHMKLSKVFSILSFCVMEGVIAIVQMFNKELLLVGFGTAATVFIMYFTVENPDAQTINRLAQANKRARDLIRFYSTTPINKKNHDSMNSSVNIFSDVCVLFLDVVDFSKFANRMGIERLARYLSNIFERIESAADSFRVEKIRSFGSSYTAIAGIPSETGSNTSEMMHFALEILNIVKKTNAQNGMNLQLRIGMACGSVVADLVGNQNFVSNAWGQPIAFAELLQRNCQPNAIHVSENVYNQLKEIYDFKELAEEEYEGMGRLKTWQFEPV
ncbi:MAG: adenylate/guanylate cyclase domain-containing protein [Treponema sp.]|nr:adenylate/guanylate cyclase domain-containing protein [Treponema sp.]